MTVLLIISWDHVYFVHPSTDALVDILTNSRPMYWSTYRPSVDRYVGPHLNMSVERQSVGVMQACHNFLKFL